LRLRVIRGPGKDSRMTSPAWVLPATRSSCLPRLPAATRRRRPPTASRSPATVRNPAKAGSPATARIPTTAAKNRPQAPRTLRRILTLPAATLWRWRRPPSIRMPKRPRTAR